MDNLDRLCRLVSSTSRLVMEDATEACQARRAKLTSTAAALRFGRNGGGTVHCTRANPAPWVQPRNPTLVSRQEIDGAVSCPDRFVIVRSPSTRG